MKKPEEVWKIGVQGGKVFLTPGHTAIIGRFADCHISLPESDVSRLHGVVRFPKHGAAYYVDVGTHYHGSTNGSFLQKQNGSSERLESLKKYFIFHGMTLSLGSTKVVFEKEGLPDKGIETHTATILASRPQDSHLGFVGVGHPDKHTPRQKKMIRRALEQVMLEGAEADTIKEIE